MTGVSMCCVSLHSPNQSFSWGLLIFLGTVCFPLWWRDTGCSRLCAHALVLRTSGSVLTNSLKPALCLSQMRSWGVLLSVSKIGSLASGFSPVLLRSGNLLGSPRLTSTSMPLSL